MVSVVVDAVIAIALVLVYASVCVLVQRIKARTRVSTPHPQGIPEGVALNLMGLPQKMTLAGVPTG